MTILFENMLDNSVETIRQYLPEDYEIDDVTWDAQKDLFQIPVFDASSVESYEKGMVACFRFYRLAQETDEEAGERWLKELNEFNHRW